MTLSSLPGGALRAPEKHPMMSNGGSAGESPAPLSAAMALPLGTMLDRFGAAQ
jgi:hypothetical protein